MTRFLSHALQAPEPFFRLGIRRLEHANGTPNVDIRLTNEVQSATRDKLRQLGLDPADTTAEELYQALQQRLAADDRRLTRHLRTLAATHVSAEADVVAGMIHALKELPDSKRCFALKPSSLKSLLKQVPPKKAMKQLGYRSFDSFVKHEQPASILAAAWLTEGTGWQRKFTDQYKRLRPSDFENRNIMFLHPTSLKWRQLAEQAVAQKRHNLICFKEAGTLVFLPFTANVPSGAVLASLSLALHCLNDIRATSTFLKLSQVRGDFGRVVVTAASATPALKSQVLDQPVPWHMIQRYYARFSERFREEIFEPHVQLEDMVWHPVEQTLAALDGELAFWEETAHLGILHNGRPVSLNLVDAALNYCNRLPFEQRLTHYFRHSLWHELLMRYLKHDTVERSVLQEIQPQLATETISV